MKLLEIDSGSSGLYWAVEEYTVSSLILPLTGTALSRNPGISISGGNPSHMSGLLAMVAQYLPNLTSSPDLSLARMAAALEPT